MAAEYKRKEILYTKTIKNEAEAKIQKLKGSHILKLNTINGYVSK